MDIRFMGFYSTPSNTLAGSSRYGKSRLLSILKRMVARSQPRRLFTALSNQEDVARRTAQFQCQASVRRPIEVKDQPTSKICDLASRTTVHRLQPQVRHVALPFDVPHGLVVARPAERGPFKFFRTNWQRFDRLPTRTRVYGNLTGIPP